MKRILSIFSAAVFAFAAAGCGEVKKTEVNVFAAASLSASMAELETGFEKVHPDVDIVLNTDSSGTLMTQIEAGAAADIFFSAGQKQMDELEKKGFLLEGTRKDIVGNSLCVVTLKDSNTKCMGINTLGKAESLAVAAVSVPAGLYTRQALAALGYIKGEDSAAINAAELRDILGTEISEQGNVSKVLATVAEGASEVGTVYRSDTYGYENFRIIEQVDKALTGDIVYPAAMIKNKDASDERVKAGKEFFEYMKSDAAKAIYEKYYMDAI